MDFIPSEISMPSLLPAPTTRSPSIFVANLLLVCFTPAIICGFFVRHYILRPLKASESASTTHCGVIPGKVAAISVQDQNEVSSRIRPRSIYLVKLVICLLLTLAGLMEILKARFITNSELTQDIDGFFSIQGTVVRTLDNLNKCIGWFGLLSICLMYFYIVFQLLPPRCDIRIGSLFAFDGVSRPQLNNDAHAGEMKLQSEKDTESFYFWIKIPLFIPPILLVFTLRALLITTKVESYTSSDFKITIQSVRLATKLFSLVLDLILLIWILFHTLKMSTTIPSFKVTSIRRINNSLVANPAVEGLERSSCNYRTQWCRRVGANQTRRKIARIHRSWSHDQIFPSALQSPRTSISVNRADSYLRPALSCSKSSLIYGKTKQRCTFSSFTTSIKNIGRRISAWASQCGSGQHVVVRKDGARHLQRARSWACVAACILKSPMVASQIISIICCIISLTSTEDGGEWRESKLMDSLISGAIGYEGSIGYLLVVVMTLLRIYFILVEPADADLCFDVKNLDLERHCSSTILRDEQKNGTPHYMKARAPVTSPVGKRTIGIRRASSDPHYGSSFCMKKSQSFGPLISPSFNRTTNNAEFNGRLAERTASPSSSGTRSIKRVPVPDAFNLPLGSKSFLMESSPEEAHVRDRITNRGMQIGSSMELFNEASRQRFRDQSSCNVKKANLDEAMIRYAESRRTGTGTLSTLSSQSSTHPLCRYPDGTFEGSDVSSIRSPPPRRNVTNSSGSFGIYLASDPPDASTPSQVANHCDCNPKSPAISSRTSIIQPSEWGSSWNTNNLSKHSQLLQQLHDELGMSRTASSESKNLSGHQPYSKSSISTFRDSSCSSDLENVPQTQAQIRHISDVRPSVSFFSLREAISANANFEAYNPEGNLTAITRNTLTSIEEKEEIPLHDSNDSHIRNAGDEPDMTKTPLSTKSTLCSDRAVESSDSQTKAGDHTTSSVHKRLSDSPSQVPTLEKSIRLQRSLHSPTESKFNESQNDRSPGSIRDSPRIEYIPLEQELCLSEISTSITPSQAPDLDDVSRLHRKLSSDHSSLLGKPRSTATFLNFSSLPSSPTSADFSRSHCGNSTLNLTHKNSSFEKAGRLRTEDHMSLIFPPDSIGGSTSASTVASEMGLLGYTRDIELDKLIGSNPAHHHPVFKSIEFGGTTSVQNGTHNTNEIKQHSARSDEDEIQLPITSGNCQAASTKKRTVSSLLNESVLQASQVLSRRVGKNVPLLGPILPKRFSQESFHCAGENATYGQSLSSKPSPNLVKTRVSESDRFHSERLDRNRSATIPLSTAPTNSSPNCHANSLRKLHPLKMKDSLSSTTSCISLDASSEKKESKNSKQAKLRKYFEDAFARSSPYRSAKTPATHHSITPDQISLPQPCDSETMTEMDTIRAQDRSTDSLVDNRLTQIWIPGRSIDQAPQLKLSLDFSELTCNKDEHRKSLEAVRPVEFNNGTFPDCQGSKSKVGISEAGPSSSNTQPGGYTLKELEHQQSLSCLMTTELSLETAEEGEKVQESVQECSARNPEKSSSSSVEISSPSEEGLTSQFTSMTASELAWSHRLSSNSTDSGEWNPFSLDPTNNMTHLKRVSSGVVRLTENCTASAPVSFEAMSTECGGTSQ